MTTKNRLSTLGAALGAAMTMLTNPAPAMAQGGAFDFLDPCIAAGETVSQQRSKMLTELQAGIARAEAIKPTAEYAKLWWLEKRKALRPTFDAKVLPLLPGGLTAPQKDAAFKLWLDQLVAAEGGWAKVNALIEADWNRMREREIADARAQVGGALDQQDHELHAQCPADFGNQLLRGTLVLTMAPINQATRNIEIAKREGTLLGQITAATTGISVADIARNGLLGGDGSTMRTGAKAIQPVVDVLKAPVNAVLGGIGVKL
jgi:hypothetical protein